MEDALSGEVVEEDDVDGALARLVVDHVGELYAAKVSGEHHGLNEGDELHSTDHSRNTCTSQFTITHEYEFLFIWLFRRQPD